MQKPEFHIPSMSWLIGGSKIGGIYNTYTASVGTDPSEGIFAGKIFNYKIKMNKLEESENISLDIYFGTKCIDETSEDDIITSVYPAEEESLILIKAKLDEEFDKFYE